MVMEFSKEQMDKWEDRSTKKTMEYHNALLELLQKKLDKNNNELDKKDYQDVLDTFSSAVSIQRTIIDLHLENARQALDEAFKRCNFNLEDFSSRGD